MKNFRVGGAGRGVGRGAVWIFTVAATAVLIFKTGFESGETNAETGEVETRDAVSGAAAEVSPPDQPIQSNPTASNSTQPRLTFLHALPSDPMRLTGLPIPPARRVRMATIDPAWLDRKESPLFDPAASGLIVSLPLWDDVELSLRLRGSEVLGQDRHLVRGEIEGRPGSRFLMTVAGDAVAFSVYLGAGQRHAAVPAGNNEVALYELDLDAMAGCAGVIPSLLDADALAAAAARPTAARRELDVGNATASAPIAAAAPMTTAQVDVLVLYTSEVLANAEPDSALTARVDLAFAEANDEFTRSETRVQIRRVGLRQTVLTETGSNGTALERLRRTNDGFIDEIHAVRDQLGADLVCLLVQRNDPSSIGIAYILDSPNDPERGFNDLFGFSVVQNAVLAGTSTFTHELGHNLGCAHDRENSSSAGAFPFSYGYRFVGANGNTYRTIMAYQPGRSIPHFSNPRVNSTEAARPTGIEAGLPGEADNATSINRLAYEVASYRRNRVDPPARGRLVNVSTRAWVGDGEQVLIGGFFIGAPGPKQVVLRVRGASLTQFNIPDALPNPQLQLVRQSDGQLLDSNTDWTAAANAAAITAAGLAPSDPLEPAILVTLDEGGYTAIASGENGATGIALIEVFEVDEGSQPKLVNLSTRGYVSNGDRVMIGGIIVNGNEGETKRILLRAIGPSLGAHGIQSPLFDPWMRLYNQAGEQLIDNDDWDYLSDRLQSEIAALGMQPGVRRESALLLDLPPGNYTVIVQPFESVDQPAQPGIGLVEAYEITQ